VKTPLIKIDVRDWTGDPRLRLVSLAARGLWLECLCIMRSAPRTGYLETSRGVPVPDGSLARIAGVPKEELPALMRELLDAGIPDIEAESGVWHCRRMSAEAAKAIKCGAAGRRGGGNPALKSDERKPRERDERKAAKPDKEPKVEAASAVTEAVPFAALMSPEQSASHEFTAAWIQWIDFRKHKKNAIQDNTARLQLSKLSAYADIATQVAVIEQSIMQGWTGLFDLKPSSSTILLRNPSTRVRPVMDTSADDFAGQIDAAMERSAVEQ
jgi:hypothetical protein